ncbi:MAG: diguanylate cyclase [Candidatus Aminicenantes bacterium]|nr:diguanylate cyclase [Candidatus Aminicenantes bacterium]
MKERAQTKEQLLAELKKLRRENDRLAKSLAKRKPTEAFLRESEKRYRGLFDNIPIGLYRTTPKGKIMEANPALVQMLGFADRDSLLKRDVASGYLNPGDQIRWKTMIEREGIVCNFEMQLRRSDGTSIWIREFARAIKDDKGRVLFYEGSMEDITARKTAEDEFRKSADRYRSYIELTEQVGWVTNADGEVEEDIPAWRKYTGQTYDGVKGQGWAKAIHPEDLAHTVEAWKKAVTTKSPYEVEYRIRRHDGVYRHFIARGSPALNEDGEIREWVGTCIDITERKRMEAELFAMSITDQLTGLYNRRGFITLAEQQLKLSKRSKKALLLFFCDLDELKSINDTLGHEEGDNAIVEMAHIFKESFRDSDIIARIGGDEFALLAIGTDGINPEYLTARLMNNINAHNALEKRRYKISVSIGLSSFNPDHPCSIDDLMSRADKLMYKQKKLKQLL